MSVILPGSYDPITLGHLDIVKRALERYKEVFVVAFINPDKKYTFTEEERVKMLALATEGLEGVTVDFSCGRVVDYMKEHGISAIVKGYRNESDLEYEKKMAQYNFEHGGFETVLVKSSDSLSGISSTLARTRLAEGGSLDGILPMSVIDFINNR